ncbi:PREDICTED: uncharacterized protein LOC109233745 [Nicotiana attenuata]|uniref:uncharacterized protein LOC109233745 n=1 Tax=Nicotiana attenuata TaxID=49451 RepID=UPI0009055D90|nr:PREDICTED: uncharacterized protein LOC109233745 [Nicotiana attenuata]
MNDRAQKKKITEITTLLRDKLTDPDAIKRETIDYYKSLMGTISTTLLAMNRTYMKHGSILTHQHRVDLCAEVTNQGIVESLEAIGDDKAPCINGFNEIFFKKAWDIINIQIIDAMKKFFTTGKLYKAINCTTVTLVPKVNKPTTVKEYRSIARCSILYKMISKILAYRLQKVMPYIICESQEGFIPGRNIANNVILAHEVMEELRFPDKFIRWIMECIKTVNYTIRVNGETTKPFNIAKDLRQGDPISLFIFAIMIEEGIFPFYLCYSDRRRNLSRTLHGLKKESDFQYHPRCSKLGITHMSFADELLLFSKASSEGPDTVTPGICKWFSTLQVPRHPFVCKENSSHIVATID